MLKILTLFGLLLSSLTVFGGADLASSNADSSVCKLVLSKEAPGNKIKATRVKGFEVYTWRKGWTTNTVKSLEIRLVKSSKLRTWLEKRGAVRTDTPSPRLAQFASDSEILDGHEVTLPFEISMKILKAGPVLIEKMNVNGGRTSPHHLRETTLNLEDGNI